MIQTQKLCESVGIHKDAFSITYSDEATPFVTTMTEALRQITPETVEDENMLLYETEIMFENHINMMQQELDKIRRFRAMYYGPTNHEANNTDSEGTDSSKDSNTDKE